MLKRPLLSAWVFYNQFLTSPMSLCTPAPGQTVASVRDMLMGRYRLQAQRCATDTLCEGVFNAVEKLGMRDEDRLPTVSSAFLL